MAEENRHIARHEKTEMSARAVGCISADRQENRIREIYQPATVMSSGRRKLTYSL